MGADARYIITELKRNGKKGENNMYVSQSAVSNILQKKKTTKSCISKTALFNNCFITNSLHCQLQRFLFVVVVSFLHRQYFKSPIIHKMDYFHLKHTLYSLPGQCLGKLKIDSGRLPDYRPEGMKRKAAFLV